MGTVMLPVIRDARVPVTGDTVTKASFERCYVGHYGCGSKLSWKMSSNGDKAVCDRCNLAWPWSTIVRWPTAELKRRFFLTVTVLIAPADGEYRLVMVTEGLKTFLSLRTSGEKYGW